MSIQRISRTEMAARFKKHSHHLVGGTLRDAVRGCECFALSKTDAIAIEFEPENRALISLAVSEPKKFSMLDHFEAVAHILCIGRKTRFYTKRIGLVLEAQKRGWIAHGLGGREFELSKVY